MAKKIDKKKVTKTLQFFAAYLVAAWTLLQFVDWVLIRYSISPYWVDLLLWVFIGIIPSLIIYLYNQERINNRVLKLREKIIFPLNILLLMGITYFVFGNSDLGATTKSVNYLDEQGKQQSTLITKEEFRKGFYLFNFEPKTADSTKAWLEHGITRLLVEDLLQNKNLNPMGNGSRNTSDKVREASYFHDFYVDGEFDIIDSTYSITTFIRNSANAKIIKQETFTGNDVLNLIDDITLFVTNSMASNEFNAPQYIDLDVKEFTSRSLKAVELYMKGDFENATKEDNTFALAYLTAAKKNVWFNQSKFEGRALADKAFKYRLKLPLQKQLETNIQRNLAYGSFENAEELVKLQLEVDPSDQTYNRVLYSIYGSTRNVKAYTAMAYKAFENNENIQTVHNAINARLIDEDYDRLLKDINTVMALRPNDNITFTFKLLPQLYKGDIKAAAKTQDKIKLLHPDWKNLTKTYDTAIAYLEDHKVTKADLQKFEGEYRSNNNELIMSYWVENNTLLHFASNQSITPYLVAGDNKLVSGIYTRRQTFEQEFLKIDGSNNYYAIKNNQNNGNNSVSFWTWRIDDTIKKAETLLEEKKLDSAKVDYEAAIKANPKHYYLKNALAHINYVQSIDSITLLNQYKDVAGTYGPRQFWIDQEKLFYKRKANQNGRTFPTIELLPIAKDQYITLTNLSSKFAFEYENDKVLNSYVYDYDIAKEEWIQLNIENNTFAKEE